MPEVTTRTRPRSLARLDLSVAVLLLAGWLSTPTGLGHVVAGIAFACVAGVHVSTRDGLAARLWRAAGGTAARPRRITTRRITTWIVLVAAVVMTVSGFGQWAGYQVMIPVHVVSSGVLIVAAVLHVWQRRRVLSARLRAR
jgi:hypothetical protein